MIALTHAGALDRATIINVSSISAYAVSSDRADYCMAKAALQMLACMVLLSARMKYITISFYIFQKN